MGEREIRAELVRAYSTEAPARESRGAVPWKREELERFAQRLQSEGRRRLVDLGSGPGIDAALFRAGGIQTTALDLTPAMVERSQARGIPGVVGDLAALPFREDAFDAAWAMTSLLHLPKRALPGALAEIRRVLAPGGLLFIGLYSGDHEGILANDTVQPQRFFAFYQPDELLAMATAEFTLEDFHEVVADPARGRRALCLLLRRPAG